MATFYSNNFLNKVPLKPHPTTTTKTTATTTKTQQSRRKIHLRKRGRRLPTIQLGGGKKPTTRRRGFFLTKLFRRARLKWLRLSMFKKLKQYYKALIKDLIEASAYQERIYMESSLATVPGISFSNFHGGSTLTTPKSVFI